MGLHIKSYWCNRTTLRVYLLEQSCFSFALFFKSLLWARDCSKFKDRVVNKIKQFFYKFPFGEKLTVIFFVFIFVVKSDKILAQVGIRKYNFVCLFILALTNSRQTL